MAATAHQGISPPVSATKRLGELNALVEMTREIHSTMRVDRLLQILVEKAVVGISFDRCLIYLLEQDFLRCVAVLDRVKRDSAAIIRTRIGFAIDDVAVETLAAKLGKSMYVENAKTDHRMNARFLEITDTSEYCVVPLIGRDRVIGVFTGDKFYSKNPITAHDISTLEIFVRHVSLAIENARLYEEKEQFASTLADTVSKRTSQLREANQKLSEKMRKLSTLYKMAALLGTSLDTKGIVANILSLLKRLGHDFCGVYLLDEAGGSTATSPGLVRKSVAFTGSPFSSSFLESLNSNRNLVIIRGDDEDALEHEALVQFEDVGIVEICVIPITVQDMVAGTIAVFSEVAREMVDDQRNFLIAFGQQASMALGNALAYQRAIEEQKNAQMATSRLERENIYLRGQIKKDLDVNFVVGKTVRMKKVMEIIRKAAQTSASVMIYGETGTGKELVAKTIHALGPRRERPMIALNCAAIPESLLESELFGHERGAFTGAHERKIGMFEMADQGTLLLDEIGEIPLQMQTKLLRVLQEREIRRIGGKATIKVDVRVLAATNKDLRAKADEGAFRSDLYYRLNVVPIYLPPLRERPQDIEELLEFCIEKCVQGRGKHISVDRDVVELFRKYSWPGNVRELQNVVERLAIISDTGRIRKQDLPREMFLVGDAAEPIQPLREAVKDFKRSMVERALAETGGQKSRAAHILGLHKPNFSRLLRDLGFR